MEFTDKNKLPLIIGSEEILSGKKNFSSDHSLLKNLSSEEKKEKLYASIIVSSVLRALLENSTFEEIKKHFKGDKVFTFKDIPHSHKIFYFLLEHL